MGDRAIEMSSSSLLFPACRDSITWRVSPHGLLQVHKSWDEEVQMYLRQAEAGDSEAQFRVGQCHRFGDVLGCDPQEALRWFKLAAQRGHMQAQLMVATCHLYGIGVSKDATTAVQLLHLCAEEGLAEAQNMLGQCHQAGTGVPKDAKK